MHEGRGGRQFRDVGHFFIRAAYFLLVASMGGRFYSINAHCTWISLVGDFFSRRGPRFYGVCAFFLKGRIILAPGGDFIPVKKSPGRITPELHAGLPGLENIVIFSKISKYRKHQKYHDIFDIFDIFQKMEISSKLL